MQGDQPADCGSPLFFSQGGEILFMPPEFMKGGIDSMLTYGDFIAKATLYISIVSLVLDFIIYFDDHKKK